MGLSTAGRGDAPTISDGTVPGPHGAVPIRTYDSTVTERPVGLVWLHGGAFRDGDLDMPESDWVARELAGRGITVVTVDYRLAVGGVHFPVPVDDVMAVWKAVSAGAGERWSIGGASAGACLAASAAVRLSDSPAGAPSRLVLIYPLVHHEIPLRAQHVASMNLSDRTDRFTAEDVHEISVNYVGNAARLADPDVFPGNGPLAGLPPTLIVNADHDDLRPSGEEFARQLGAAGIPVSMHHVLASTHGFLNTPHDAALPTIDAIADWVLRAPGLPG